jgi:hypothetical protein
VRRLPPVYLAAAAAVVCLGGCGGRGSSTTTTAAPPSITTSDPQKVTSTGLRRAIELLYQHEPTIRGFVAQDVEYTPKTRNKVLSVCQHGGPETNAAALESAKIAGCAPLVFFFYKYGSQKSVPESIDVARDVYWYAATKIHGPFDAHKALTALLVSWGVP